MQTGSMMEKLFDFVVSKSYEDLSEEVIEGTKDRLLDFIGCVFSGYEEMSSDIVSEFIEECGDNQESTIIGNGKTTAQYAALANGILGHSRELDDEHKSSVAHLGVAVIPASLALCEKKGGSGKELITSIVMGYEVAARIGMAVCSDILLAKGFHPTGLVGVFGSTTGASKMLELDRSTTMSAMGIAGSLASGLFEFIFDGSWTKRLHPGWAAHNGIIAALLADKGFTGPHSVITGRYGFAKAFSGCLEEERLSIDLGKTCEILRTSYKRHACCSFIHPLIDAALKILDRERIDFDNIAAIRCKIFSAAMPIIVEPWEEKKRVMNTVDAQFNAFYSLAFSIYKKTPLWGGFSQEDLRNPAIIELSRKITIEREQSFDQMFPERFPAEVKISLTNGQQFVEKVSTNKGSPSWPMSREEIETKFRILSSQKCSSKCCDQIIDGVRNLDSLKEVVDLCSLLRIPPK